MKKSKEEKSAQKKKREARVMTVAVIIVAAVFVLGLSAVLFFPRHNEFKSASLRVLPYSDSNTETKVEGYSPNKIQNAFERMSFRQSLVTDSTPDYTLVFEDGDIYYVKASSRDSEGCYRVSVPGKNGEAKTGGRATAELDKVFAGIKATLK